MDDVNGSGDPVDYLGLNNGTAVGNAVQVEAGALGKGFEFDGVNDYISLSNQINNSGDITVSSWFKLDALTATYGSCIFCTSYMNYGPGDRDGYGLYTNVNDEKIHWKQYGHTSNYEALSDVLTLGQWYHAVGVMNTTNIILYLDGQLIQSSTLNMSDTNNSNYSHRIGSDGRFTYQDFNGTIDDVMIFNRSLSLEEIQGLYANTSVEYLENNYTGLTDGNYTFRAYAQDEGGNVNFTELRTVTVDTNNTVPDDPVVSINSSDGSNKTLQDLNCLATLVDDDGDNMNVSVRWYKGGVLNFTVNYSEQANGTAFAGVLDDGNTTKGDVWKCGMRLYDGFEYSSWVNSSNLTILNTAPVVTLNAPADNSATTDRTPEFNWTSSDDDNDSMTYEINISHLGGVGCVDLDEVESGIGGLSYTPSPDLNCLYDNGDYYVWKVRADDGEVNGSWTSEWTINISALVSVKLLDSVISFGDMVPGDSNDTATSALNPFKIENNGTVYVNISVNASALWTEAPSSSSYYRFKVDNVSGEEGAFSWLTSLTSWFNVPFTGYVVGIDYLNYSDVKDSAEVDILLEVPPSEDPGVKNSNVVLKAELAE
jgi:hypothetical protein